MSDISWYEIGVMPPIGEKVDVVGSVVYGAGEVNCEVISYVENCAVIRMSYGLGCFEPDRLKPSIADKKMMSEWVSVNDRLPDETRPEVLFYSKAFKRVELGKYNEFTKEWMVPFSSYSLPAAEVTHWMQLPDAPK